MRASTCITLREDKIKNTGALAPGPGQSFRGRPGGASPRADRRAAWKLHSAGARIRVESASRPTRGRPGTASAHVRKRVGTQFAHAARTLRKHGNGLNSTGLVVVGPCQDGVVTLREGLFRDGSSSDVTVGGDSARVSRRRRIKQTQEVTIPPTTIGSNGRKGSNQQKRRSRSNATTRPDTRLRGRGLDTAHIRRTARRDSPRVRSEGYA